jgi:hypothetical protein
MFPVELVSTPGESPSMSLRRLTFPLNVSKEDNGDSGI